MTPAIRSLSLLPIALTAALALASAAATAQGADGASHDYPTAERVIWVEACMREHPDAYDTMHTESLATSIGGERGAVFRDTPEVQDKIKAFRKLQAEAQANCMIAPPAKR
jgi:hypothetical protein